MHWHTAVQLKGLLCNIYAPTNSLHSSFQLVSLLDNKIILIFGCFCDERRSLRHETCQSTSAHCTADRDQRQCSPNSLSPCIRHSCSAQLTLNSRTRASSDLLCMRTSRLRDLAIASSSTAERIAMRHSDTAGLLSETLIRVATGTCWMTKGCSCRSLSLRQKTEKER